MKSNGNKSLHGGEEGDEVGRWLGPWHGET